MMQHRDVNHHKPEAIPSREHITAHYCNHLDCRIPSVLNHTNEQLGGQCIKLQRFKFISESLS